MACRWLPCCALMWPFSVNASLASLPLLTSTLILLDEGPALMTRFKLNCLFKALSPNIVTLGGVGGGVRASTWEFLGTYSVSMSMLAAKDPREVPWFVQGTQTSCRFKADTITVFVFGLRTPSHAHNYLGAHRAFITWVAALDTH